MLRKKIKSKFVTVCKRKAKAVYGQKKIKLKFMAIKKKIKTVYGINI